MDLDYLSSDEEDYYSCDNLQKVYTQDINEVATRVDNGSKPQLDVDNGSGRCSGQISSKPLNKWLFPQYEDYQDDIFYSFVIRNISSIETTRIVDVIRNTSPCIDAQMLLSHILDNKDVCIAGGFALYAIDETQYIKELCDIDIFILNNNYETMCNVYNILINVYNLPTVYFKDGIIAVYPLAIPEKDFDYSEVISFQIIFTDRKSPMDLIHHFDLDYIQCAFTLDKIIQTNLNINAVNSKIISFRAEDLEYKRLEKALRKGYTVTRNVNQSYFVDYILLYVDFVDSTTIRNYYRRSYNVCDIPKDEYHNMEAIDFIQREYISKEDLLNEGFIRVYNFRDFVLPRMIVDEYKDPQIKDFGEFINKANYDSLVVPKLKHFNIFTRGKPDYDFTVEEVRDNIVYDNTMNQLENMFGNVEIG